MIFPTRPCGCAVVPSSHDSQCPLTYVHPDIGAWPRERRDGIGAPDASMTSTANREAFQPATVTDEAIRLASERGERAVYHLTDKITLEVSRDGNAD